MFFPLLFHHSKALVIVLRMKCVLAECMMYLLLWKRKKSIQYSVCLCRRCKNSAIARMTEFYEAILYFACGMLRYSYCHQCYVCK